MSTRNQVGLVTDTVSFLTLEQLCQRYVHNADLLLAEGYSAEPLSKILVRSCEKLEQERIPLGGLLIAVVGERPINCSLPQFSFRELDTLATLLEQRFLLPQREPAEEAIGLAERIQAFEWAVWAGGFVFL